VAKKTAPNFYVGDGESSDEDDPAATGTGIQDFEDNSSNDGEEENGEGEDDDDLEDENEDQDISQALDRFLGLRRTSTPAKKRMPKKTDDDYSTLIVGTYVAAVYDNAWYICQVEGEEEEDETPGFTLLRYMNFMGHNQYFWDEKPDILKTNHLDILCKTSFPVPVSSRYMGLKKEDVVKVDKLFRFLVNILGDKIHFSPLKNFLKELKLILTHTVTGVARVGGGGGGGYF